MERGAKSIFAIVLVDEFDFGAGEIGVGGDHVEIGDEGWSRQLDGGDGVEQESIGSMVAIVAADTETS